MLKFLKGKKNRLELCLSFQCNCKSRRRGERNFKLAILRSLSLPECVYTELFNPFINLQHARWIRQ